MVTSKSTSSLLTRRYRPISSNERAAHVLFWVITYAILLWTDPLQYGLGVAIAETLLQVVFFAIIVYANIYYFFPKYLKNRNIWKHIALLVLFSLAITPIKTVTFFKLYSQAPDIQVYFLKNRFNIFFSCLLLGMATTLYSILRDWVNNQRLQQEIQNKTLQTELNFLKSQINPHFLFNTLNNLYALTLKKSDQAPEIVLRLSEMMRYMLYECNEPEVPLSKELQFIKSYIELEKLRQGAGFDIQLDITGDPQNYLIAPQLLIPFIENCFKHGINRAMKEGYVHIEIEITSDGLVMHVANSKVAQEDEAKDRKKRPGGIGLTNVKRRLSLLYPNAYQLKINNAINKYEVTFSLRLDVAEQQKMVS